MNITEVRIKKIDSDSKLKAIASITIDGDFAVHDLKIIEGKNGIFVAMPSRKVPDGSFKDIVHPISTEVREELQNAIISEYNKLSDEDDDEAEEIVID